MKRLITFKEIQQQFDNYLLLEDRGVVRVTLATTIANQIGGNPSPTWLMMVAASSSGKSEILDSLLDIKYGEGDKAIDLIYPISDLTPNTFASGYNAGQGKKGSLLDTIPKKGAVFVFKDFTTLLSKNKDAQQAIMAQLREIFDGSFTKRTGTGDIKWDGRVGCIAAVTEMVYETDEKMSAMGARFIMYDVEQPDRIEVAKRKIQNRYDKESETKKKADIRASVKQYVEQAKEREMLEEFDFQLTEEQEMNIINVSDMSTRARSGVLKDFKGEKIVFVPSPEMPMRMMDQLISLARAFMFMNKMDGEEGNLTDEDMNILYKIALASIPKKRRMALQVLTRFKKGVSTKGMSDMTQYPMSTVKIWLEELRALGMITKIQEAHQNNWHIEDRWRNIMSQFENIEVLDEALIPDDDEDEAFNAFGASHAADEDDWGSSTTTTSFSDFDDVA